MTRVVRQIFPAKLAQPDWKRLLGTDHDVFRQRLAALPASAPRVLLAPMVGSPWMTNIDSLLGVALTLRGARAHVLVCDEVLPACHQSNRDLMPSEKEFVAHGPRRALCASCHRSADRMFTELGLPVERLSQYLTPAELADAEATAAAVPLAEIAGFRMRDLALGEHAQAGAIRFFARASIHEEPLGEPILRRYLRAAIMTAHAVWRLLDRYDFRVVSAHHGIYVPQGIIGEVARRRKVRVANWAIAYRKGRVIFSHGDTYHHTLMAEPTASWESLPWTPARDAELLDYLKSRWTGVQDWISFNRAPVGDAEAIRQELGIDFSSKPTIGLLTNVLWDAQLHYPQNAFRDMLDWLMTTIKHFAGRPDLQLLIRVHPAELTGQIKSQQPVVEEIRRAFDPLPANVFVIPPASKISTYACMLQCDSVLIYGTKTGVELTSFGIPVVVAGEAWIRNKGLTIDVQSKEHYQELLGQLPLRRRMTPAEMERARKYAYHFFFRRMIPLGVLGDAPPGSDCPFSIDIRGLADLQPGRDPGLDAVCAGIVDGSEFIYAAEREPAQIRVA